MRIVLILTLLLTVPLPAHAALFSSGPEPDAEITASQYGALLAVRDVAPKMFRQTLLPLIETAMKDGKISNAELGQIEKAAGKIGPEFLAAAKAPSVSESFNEAVNAAGKKSVDLGDKLNETLSENVPKLLDDAMNFFREQLNKPTAPAAPPATPQTGVTDL